MSELSFVFELLTPLAAGESKSRRGYGGLGRCRNRIPARLIKRLPPASAAGM